MVITGAQSRVLVDGEVAASWSVLSLSPGQTLSLQPARRGLRSYLAIENGFDVTYQLGSASTDPLLGIGGTSANGHPLIKGERLSQQSGRARSRTTEQSFATRKTPQRVASRFTINYLLRTHPANDSGCIRLKVVPCYQVDKFSEATLKAFTEQEFEVSKDSNRMGIRLLGTRLFDNHTTATQIVSEGVVPRSGSNNAKWVAYDFGCRCANHRRIPQIRCLTHGISLDTWPASFRDKSEI